MAENNGRQGDGLIPAELPEFLQKIRARTPARILMGRAGAAYPTGVQLDLRQAHAAARDAVRGELDLMAAFGAEFVREWQIFEVQSQAASKDEFLLRPDLGRHFTAEAKAKIQQRCERERDLQIVIGDGLSVPAVARQVPAILPLIWAGAKDRGWSLARPFAVRYCRVGILNEVGDLLEPRVVVLLIGERPGLATAESLSAYMAYSPRAGHTDADRNLISNIHARGVPAREAAARVLHLAQQMMEAKHSGYSLKETPPSPRLDG